MEPVYAREDDVITPIRFAAGPWDPAIHHGVAPAALLARAIEAAQPPGAGQVARITIDLIRPVALRALKVTTRTLRNGRNLQPTEPVLTANSTQVARATAVRIPSLFASSRFRLLADVAAARSDPCEGAGTMRAERGGPSLAATAPCIHAGRLRPALTQHPGFDVPQKKGNRGRRF